MNKKSSAQRRHNFTVFRQLCNLIPTFLVPQLAAQTGVDKLCRKFSTWSHVVAMLSTQLTHCIGLNDLCDSLQLHQGPLSQGRGRDSEILRVISGHISTYYNSELSFRSNRV